VRLNQELILRVLLPSFQLVDGLRQLLQVASEEHCIFARTGTLRAADAEHLAAVLQRSVKEFLFVDVRQETVGFLQVRVQDDGSLQGGHGLKRGATWPGGRDGCCSREGPCG